MKGSKRYGRKSLPYSSEDFDCLADDEDDTEVRSSTKSLKHSLTADSITDTEEVGNTITLVEHGKMIKCTLWVFKALSCLGHSKLQKSSEFRWLTGPSFIPDCSSFIKNFWKNKLFTKSNLLKSPLTDQTAFNTSLYPRCLQILYTL